MYAVRCHRLADNHANESAAMFKIDARFDAKTVKEDLLTTASKPLCETRLLNMQLRWQQQQNQHQQYRHQT